VIGPDKLAKKQEALKARSESEKLARKRKRHASALSGGHVRRLPGCLAEEIALIPGGIDEFMRWVRGAALRDKKFEPLIEAFFKLSVEEQNGHRLEEICRSLGIYPPNLFGAAVQIAYEIKREHTKLLTSLAMPHVMETNIREAKKADGVEDRRMFMQSTGILPVPKGSTINVSANAQAASVTNTGEPTGLPSFEDSVVSFSEIIRNAVEKEPPALPEPSTEVIVEGD